MEWIDSLLQNYGQRLVASVVVVVTVLLVRLLVVRVIRRTRWRSDMDRLAWLARVRWTTFFTLLGGLVMVWATQIEAVAVSAVALAAAIVIATKELILCISGGVVRIAGEAFSIGDRIEVGEVRGDVVDLGLFTTTVLEVGAGQQRTGRSVTLPNSLFLATPVVNETHTDEFVLHSVTVPVAATEDWARAERALLAAAQHACEPHLEGARKHMERKATLHGLSPPSVEPRVLVHLPEPARRDLVLRFPTPVLLRARIEQQILRDYLHATGPLAEVPGAEE